MCRQHTLQSLSFDFVVFGRRLETTPNRYVAEFWNTLSNAPFCILALLRIAQLGAFGSDHFIIEQLQDAYLLMFIIGAASAYHHATTAKWTILVDWTPIAISILYACYYSFYLCIGAAELFQVLLALSLLIADHVWHLMPVPWGHVCWHLVAALAIDTVYQGVLREHMDLPLNYT